MRDEVVTKEIRGTRTPKAHQNKKGAGGRETKSKPVLQNRAPQRKDPKKEVEVREHKDQTCKTGHHSVRIRKTEKPVRGTSRCSATASFRLVGLLLQHTSPRRAETTSISVARLGLNIPFVANTGRSKDVQLQIHQHQEARQSGR